MPRECHRCGEELPPAGSSAGAFCPHCGAPQLQISGERVTDGEAADATTGHLPPPRPRPIAWRSAMRYSVAVALAGAALWLLGLRFPALSLLSWPLVVSGSVIVLGLYQRRQPAERISAGIGAQIGLFFGVVLDVFLAAGLAIAGLIARFVTHRMGTVDAEIAAGMKAQIDQAIRVNSAPPEAVHYLQSVEFRTGVILLTLVFLGVLLAGLATLGGAASGYLGRRRQPAR